MIFIYKYVSKFINKTAGTLPGKIFIPVKREFICIST